MVLAGGEGKRLWPLTIDRAKPAVPFGGSYRLIDFALSNLVNAGFMRIAVLTQYKSHSLDRHVASTWQLSTLFGNYIAPVPAQMRRGPHWFAGSADAIYQNLNLIYDEKPEVILVFGADHVYRIDPRQMIDQHLRGRSRRHGRRLAGADRAGERVRGDGGRGGRPEDRGVPGEAGAPGRSSRCARRGLRLDGQLRLRGEGPDRRGHRRREERRVEPRRRARHHPDVRRVRPGAGVRLRELRRAGRIGARARVLA